MADSAVPVAESDVSGLYLKEFHAEKLASVIVLVFATSISVSFFSKSPIIVLQPRLDRLILVIAQRFLAVTSWRRVPYIAWRRFMNPALYR